MTNSHAYCSECGAEHVEKTWPRTCVECGQTHYLNPKPVAVILQPVDGGLLTVRRGIPPREGSLALPGGFIDVGESWQKAGARELFEETGLAIDAEEIELFDVVSAPDGTVLIFGLAATRNRSELPEFRPNSEVSELVIVDRPEELAFPIHTDILGRWIEQNPSFIGGKKMTTITRIALLLITALIAALAFSGCDINRHTGEHGQLVFEYYSQQDRYNFNKPIIEGGYLDIFLYDIPEGRPVEVLSATALTPDRGRVEGATENLVVVQGITTGWAKFEVRAIDEDEELRVDVIRMRVDGAHSIHFRPEGARVLDGLSLSKEALSNEALNEEKVGYLEVTTGSRVEIPWTRRSAKKEPLVGYGVYPIAIDPPDAAELHDRLTTHDTVTLFMPDEPTTFELVPAKGLRGDRLIIEVVSADLVAQTAIAGRGIAHNGPAHEVLAEHPVLVGFEGPERTMSRLILESRITEDGRKIREFIPWILTWFFLGLLLILSLRSLTQIRRLAEKSKPHCHYRHPTDR